MRPQTLSYFVRRGDASKRSGRRSELTAASRAPDRPGPA
ncbi:Hypothetical protein A7982_06529 [Minicystis rosea]|nr:Hypothetical protein A7982_06529 [Minicystis rosea]